jgi:hypothetical protein
MKILDKERHGVNASCLANEPASSETTSVARDAADDVRQAVYQEKTHAIPQ